MEAISVINLLPSNKDEVIDFFNRVKVNVLDSGENPFKFAVQLKAFEQLIKNLRDDNEIQDWIIEEALKEGKSFEFLGNRIDIKEFGTSYNYSACGDSEWESLNEQIIELTAKKKERENFLKAIPVGGTVVPETGELIHPPSKTSKTNYSVTLK